MPTLRLYPGLAFKSSWKEVRENILSDEENFAAFDENDRIIRSGVYRNSNVLRKIEDTDFFALNYLLKQSRKIPSKKSELSYFNLIPGPIVEDTETYKYPTLIKIVMSKKKKIMGIYTRRKVKMETINQIIGKLDHKYDFQFKYPLIDNHVKFERNKLNSFLLNLEELKHYTSISVLDQDNTITAKNPEGLSETRKVNKILEEVEKNNWKFVKLRSDKLELEIRLSNERSMNYLTFLNDYIDENYLSMWIDYFSKKIKPLLSGESQKQIKLRDFY